MVKNGTFWTEKNAVPNPALLYTSTYPEAYRIHFTVYIYISWSLPHSLTPHILHSLYPEYPEVYRILFTSHILKSSAFSLPRISWSLPHSLYPRISWSLPHSLYLAYPKVYCILFTPHILKFYHICFTPHILKVIFPESLPECFLTTLGDMPLCALLLMIFPPIIRTLSWANHVASLLSSL